MPCLSWQQHGTPSCKCSVKVNSYSCSCSTASILQRIFYFVACPCKHALKQRLRCGSAALLLLKVQYPVCVTKPNIRSRCQEICDAPSQLSALQAGACRQEGVLRQLCGASLALCFNGQKSLWPSKVAQRLVLASSLT